MTPRVLVRPAAEDDLEAIADMLEDFVRGHPAHDHTRSIPRLREAYFGSSPVARLLVATHDGGVVGMAQWTRVYDMFWAMYGGSIEWLYVRPAVRGLGIAAAIAAEACRHIRDAGGEFLNGVAEAETTGALYERVAMSWPARTCYVSGEGFQVFADLAGLSPREIVRRLPPPGLSRRPARRR